VTSGIIDVKSQLFNTSSSIVGNRLVVTLSGCLDMDTTPYLKSYLDPLIRDFQAGIVDAIEFDTGQLYLMSSSSISCFATWVKSFMNMRPEWRVTFKTNPNLSWQRRSLDPIRRLAEHMVSIE